jgi:hypothetical protein
MMQLLAGIVMSIPHTAAGVRSLREIAVITRLEVQLDPSQQTFDAPPDALRSDHSTTIQRPAQEEIAEPPAVARRSRVPARRPQAETEPVNLRWRDGKPEQALETSLEVIEKAA